jgi:hypothetical protein
MGETILEEEQVGMIIITILVGLIVMFVVGRQIFIVLVHNGYLTPNRLKVMSDASPGQQDSSSTNKEVGLIPRLATIFRFLVYGTSLAYCLVVTIVQIIAPQLTSDQCKYIGKSSIMLFALQKLFLWAFLYTKTRLVQIAMNRSKKLSIINIISIVGIIAVVCYPIAGWAVFDGRKLPTFITKKCVFFASENFYVFFIMAALHDTAISVVLLIQFIKPLREHLDNFKTMKMPTDEDNGVNHLDTVVKVNLVFGVVSMISTIVTFSILAWISNQKNDLHLAAVVLPLCSMTDVLITSFSVFVISTSHLWKLFKCKKSSGKADSVANLNQENSKAPNRTTTVSQAGQTQNAHELKNLNEVPAQV